MTETKVTIEQSVAIALGDVCVGLTKTLELICNQLIENKVLNRELFLADLALIEETESHGGHDILRKIIPRALRGALDQNAQSRPEQQP